MSFGAQDVHHVEACDTPCGGPDRECADHSQEGSGFGASYGAHRFGCGHEALEEAPGRKRRRSAGDRAAETLTSPWRSSRPRTECAVVPSAPERLRV